MKPPATGFTLLEVMVVVVLIGVLASYVRLAIGDGGRTARLRDTARLLQQLTALAAQEAVLMSRPIALVVTGNQYQLQELRDGEWAERPDDPLFRARTLPDGVEMRVVSLPHGVPDAPSEAAPAIFFPDGTAEAMGIELRDPGVTATVALEPQPEGYRLGQL
jgi:type II secretion system protein H